MLRQIGVGYFGIAKVDDWMCMYFDLLVVLLPPE